MRHSIHSNFIHGINTILVGTPGLQYAVCRDHNWSGEGGEFELLILPSRPIITDEMRVLNVHEYKKVQYERSIFMNQEVQTIYNSLLPSLGQGSHEQEASHRVYTH